MKSLTPEQIAEGYKQVNEWFDRTVKDADVCDTGDSNETPPPTSHSDHGPLFTTS